MPRALSLRLPLVVVPAVLLVALLTACGNETRPPQRLDAGALLPDFELETLDGGQLARADLAGRPTVFAFWATWCQPCLKEIPLLEKLHADPSLDVVSIGLDEGGRQALEPFVHRRKISYPVLLGDQPTFAHFGGYTIPYTLLVNPDGTIAEIVRGPLRRQQVELALFGEVEHGAEPARSAVPGPR